MKKKQLCESKEKGAAKRVKMLIHVGKTIKDTII